MSRAFLVGAKPLRSECTSSQKDGPWRLDNG